MLTVHLKNLQFYAFHGVYEAEQKTGSHYEVQLQVSYNEAGQNIEELRNIINYVDLYNIVQENMLIPTSLLETVATAIQAKIFAAYSFAEEITISIFKLQAPIEHFQGKVGITLHQKRSAL
jgi:dihydroneopterin aldolase